MHLPPELIVVCERLHGSYIVDKKTGMRKHVYPNREERIGLFLRALKVLTPYAGSDTYGYALYVSYVLGHRRLVEKDSDCFEVDLPIIRLLSSRPDVIPLGCFADRLPPDTRVFDAAACIHRAYCRSKPTKRALEMLEAA